jgi:hypothetical protein
VYVANLIVRQFAGQIIALRASNACELHALVPKEKGFLKHSRQLNTSRPLPPSVLTSAASSLAKGSKEQNSKMPFHTELLDSVATRRDG